MGVYTSVYMGVLHPCVCGGGWGRGAAGKRNHVTIISFKTNLKMFYLK